MAEQQSESGGGRRLLGRAGEMAATVSGTLTGKNVEQQIQEYSDVYTQVLLGVHGDLELQSRKVDDHDREIDALKLEIASVKEMQISADEEIDALKRQIASMSGIRTLAIVALTIALVALGALGVSLWTVL